MDWEARLASAAEAHEARAARAPAEGERPDLQLAAVASAAWAGGLASLMLGRREEASTWLRRAADEYRASAELAPPGSWGRPIAALRCRLMAGDDEGARVDARWALDQGAVAAEGAIARYAAVLALLSLGRDAEAEPLAESLAGRDDFPRDVGAALSALARADVEAYERAVSSVVRSFETRDAYLEDVPVADTAIVLQAFAARRGLEVALSSPLLPV